MFEQHCCRDICRHFCLLGTRQTSYFGVILSVVRLGGGRESPSHSRGKRRELPILLPPGKRASPGQMDALAWGSWISAGYTKTEMTARSNVRQPREKLSRSRDGAWDNSRGRINSWCRPGKGQGFELGQRALKNNPMNTFCVDLGQKQRRQAIQKRAEKVQWGQPRARLRAGTLEQDSLDVKLDWPTGWTWVT